ncbi:hypothetical protein EZV62_014605 [Acer yangbiense]|uniref:Uncharacterized protein n=1 Tax=Acer yangbiense TaxID=1000413 RepID=A0A5C7HV45_9ROSI|nr:hypothetical protein EZV62_014605 [Acer yangbiense]
MQQDVIIFQPLIVVPYTRKVVDVAGLYGNLRFVAARHVVAMDALVSTLHVTEDSRDSLSKFVLASRNVRLVGRLRQNMMFCYCAEDSNVGSDGRSGGNYSVADGANA